jgi:adenine-specific DNA-methyltransferase
MQNQPEQRDVLDDPSPSVNDARRELTRARHFVRSWRETIPASGRTDFAAAFTRRALESFALEAYPFSKSDRRFTKQLSDFDSAISHVADAIGIQAARLPKFEALCFITSLYPALLAERDRSALGAFYTPLVLAQRLLVAAMDAGVDWTTARILDPAAGGGVFLFLSADRMRKALDGCEPAFVVSQIGARLRGFEVDPHAAELAQRALEVSLLELTTIAGRSLPQVVRSCDTLKEAQDGSFDLVVGNPPYGRVSLSPELRRRYSRSLFGHANTYGIFTDIALRWARKDGVIAYLTPTSFLAGQYFSNLRRVLAEDAPPAIIDFVHARRGVFEDVQQETMLAIYRKGAKASRARIHHIHVTSDVDATVTKNGTVGLPDRPSMPWLAPRERKHGALIMRVEKLRSRLSDWGYSVSTGPLVWNRFKSQLCAQQTGRDVHPLVWAEAISPDGEFVFRSEKKNHAPFFRLMAGDEWLLVKRPCVLVQRTTAKEQARRLIATELPPEFVRKHRGVVVENHLNMVRPNPDSKVSNAVVAALLNSSIVDAVFRCMSGSVAVSAFELEALPLPEISAVTKLEDLLAAKAARSLVEEECKRLYLGSN